MSANSDDSARRSRLPEVSVIVPTFNERDNVALIAAAIDRVLADVAYEIVFVDDDSSDGTLGVLQTLARQDPRIRYIHRIGRRGLSTAVSEGMLSTSSPYLAVIDADLQHDESILPQMLSLLREGSADVVVGSRYMAGGGVGDWDRSRARLSSVATRLANMLTRSENSDPMSGFFAITREAFDDAVRGLSGQGFKILLDICASAKRPLRLVNVPYQFRSRQSGESKLDALVAWDYGMLLVDKMVGQVVPARFVSFSIIGGLGVLVHMAVLAVVFQIGLAGFTVAQSIATLMAMVFNFFVNNMLTYRDRRLKGARAMTVGLLSFIALCSIGAVANVGIANFLFADRNYVWWLAGLSGILVGAVWNYAATSLITWRPR